jgi:hypothetical protein
LSAELVLGSSSLVSNRRRSCRIAMGFLRIGLPGQQSIAGQLPLLGDHFSLPAQRASLRNCIAWAWRGSRGWIGNCSCWWHAQRGSKG